jgi:subtilisin family serine protease
MGKAISLSIVVLFLMVLIPASAISPLISFPEKTEILGKEYYVEFEHEIKYEDWENLKTSEVTPLRQTTKNQILVWSTANEPLLFSDKSVFEIFNLKDDVNFKITNNEGVGLFSKYRVLLEPHLPKEGVLQVLNVLKNKNFELEENIEIENVGSIPLSFEISGVVYQDLKIDGVWKIEEIHKTEARNDIAASIIESGTLTEHKFWEFGLNGTGILIAVADTGVDLDHACFRENSTSIGEIGNNHRKIQLFNTTVDEWDSVNNSNFGHGTHIAGSLACNWDDGNLKEGTALSYDSKLLIQDIVSEEGWTPPENAELMFLEAAQNGAIIHSDSWGDNEVNYTKRSGDFDGWGREVPWSLIFVAPGNTGGQLLEPANARNVVAVGSTTKAEDLMVVGSSSIGPTNANTRGIFLVAPGKNIISAESDGVIDSFNEDTISMTGTSMATPIAASGAAIIQQMIEEGLFNNNITTNESNGFSPSGPLMKALLSLATTSVSDSSAAPGPIQGWGILNLSELISDDFEENENSTINNIWIWDSYQYEGDWSSFIDSRINSSKRPLTSLTENTWNGSGANGPFLTTGEEIRWNFTINKMEDINARLSWLAKPEPYIVDDLQLSILTSDGRIAYSNNLNNDGYSELYPVDSVPSFNSNNETTVGINLNISDLVGVDWIHVIVKGEYVGVGNIPNSIGIEGNRVGFGLAVKGIYNEVPVQLNGGGFEEIIVEDVLGYTYIGTSGIYENIEFNMTKQLIWNFTTSPGNLVIELAIENPRNVSMSLSNSPFGFTSINGLGENIEVPLCSNDGISEGINTSARGWTLEEIWWPPELVDCKENIITFNLDPKRFDAPIPLKKWQVWASDNNNGEFIAVETAWNLSSWENPWTENGVYPEGLKCEYRFENNIWENCNWILGDILNVPKIATKLDIKWSWEENGGLNRILIVQYPIPSYQIQQFPQLSFEYLTGNENILLPIGDIRAGVPIILFSESGEHAFVNMLNGGWNLDNTSMSCEKEYYWVMGVNSEYNIEFEIGGGAEIINDSGVSISALKLDMNWSQKIVDNQIKYLLLENEDEGHFISLPLKSFELLELHGKCDENNVESSNSMLKGVFWMWMIISSIMVLSAFGVWKKQQDSVKIGGDEES